MVDRRPSPSSPHYPCRLTNPLTSFSQNVQMTPRLAIALVCILTTWPVPANGQQPAKTDTVRVSGRGATRWSARGDAIRQAMQQKVAQLVIADRAVSGDSVLKDDVVSTMNGFVEGFEVIAERRNGDEIELDARVILGTGTIERYIERRRDPTAGTVDGDGMLARLQASQEFERARADVVTRLLSGFPDDAVSLTVDEVRPHPADRNLFLVFGRSRVDDGFVRQLTTGMDALLKDKCPTLDCEGTFVLNLIEESGKNRLQVLRGIVTDDAYNRPHFKWGYDGGPAFSAILYTEDAVKFVSPMRFLWMTKDPGSIDRKRGRRESERAVCGWLGPQYLIQAWYIRGSDGLCLAIGDRQFATTVLPEFLEGAKTIKGMLVPRDVSFLCEKALQFVPRHAGDPRRPESPGYSQECAGAVARLIGRPPRKVFFPDGRILLTDDLLTDDRANAPPVDEPIRPPLLPNTSRADRWRQLRRAGFAADRAAAIVLEELPDGQWPKPDNPFAQDEESPKRTGFSNLVRGAMQGLGTARTSTIGAIGTLTGSGRLRDFADRSEAEMREFYDPQGRAGRAGIATTPPQRNAPR